MKKSEFCDIIIYVNLYVQLANKLFKLVARLKRCLELLANDGKTENMFQNILMNIGLGHLQNQLVLSMLKMDVIGKEKQYGKK